MPVRIHELATGEAGQMSRDGAVGQLEIGRPGALAALSKGAQRHGIDIRHELRLVQIDGSTVVPGIRLVEDRFAGVRTRLPAFEVPIGLEDELRVAEQVEHDGQRVDADKASRLLPGTIVQLVDGVHGNGEKAAGLPFEGRLAVAADNRRRAVATEDVDDFLGQLANSLARFAGRELANVHAGQRFGADQVIESGPDAALLPPAQIDAPKGDGVVATLKRQLQIVFYPVLEGSPPVPGDTFEFSYGLQYSARHTDWRRYYMLAIP